MPRKYVRLPGSRKYRDYSDEKLSKCLDKVRNGVYTRVEAAEIYSIPVKTIYNKLKELENATVV